ncbi:response regulator (plasmid) [Pseudomonas fulva]|jgi:CheY-like chemotaxis protein|uniref:Response regulator n=3 Tax=Pseudomonas TaxID=286 RepID=A0A1X1A0M7_PSEPU|nr:MULTISPECIES: response regulator [Pseudomonas]EKT4529919.1 response regulator [Pseudomonas putida]MCT8162792.1 response regulator [Pseudomonas sp. HD6422]MCT8181439.1 response regulator [Pseudomonas sp. HD6421]MCU9528529.1 response regulator [Pseudomonas mosselii]MCU9535863.1 response regulator [Pseudomonas mosselii]
MSKIRSVCIVDDAIGMRKLGISLLEKLGYEVHVAENGYTALTVIRETNPDACFIDREMPELDGLRLIELLRGWGGWGDKPIAMLSSASSVFDQQTGLLSGADIYLTKPFTRAKLEHALIEMDELLD